MFDGATMHGDMDMLRWLRAIGADITVKAVANAAKRGDLEALQFMI